MREQGQAVSVDQMVSTPFFCCLASLLGYFLILGYSMSSE